MSGFGDLLNNVKLSNGKPASSLDGTTVVGFYFSAHWCPPCKMFTPQLAKTYNTLKQAGKKLEIVFVSSDKGPQEFDEYFAEMPWLAIPFAERGLKAKLSKLYGVQGIPTLVFVDGNGKTITTKGREAISEDPEGKQFPWIPPTVAECVGKELVKGQETISAESLKGKTIGLYFSAHWCGPCRAFTPQLAALYKKLQTAGKPFEIIFVSSDRDQASFDEYRATMPWAALPFSRRDEKNALSKRFEVEGIPTLVILDSIESGNVINAAARAAVSGDPEGADFPWHPKALNNLNENPDGINENVSVVALLGGASEASVAGIQAVADKHYGPARAKGQAHADTRFFYANSDDGVAARIRQLTKTTGPTLLILDIPDNGGFYAQPIEGDLTSTAVEAMMASYAAKSKELARQQLS